ncbi:T9SS type B sorting domain-containing protein [Seonamhaeicola maritimus]|uniref:T9SS type B sorting domain-containing protein n=1 Tax=Seonamhaeicola maritimus TaxID=2591822 RepID=UPI002495675E|nr:T9SS type B sorting domain-containing protein [Seonamhaeicola maritimus]
MKTAALVFLLFTSILYGQCPNGNVTFNSQTDVDQFVIDYPNCESINGDLTITGAVNNLSDLDYIESIEGSFTIKNTQLVNISNFNSLATVLNKIEISNNADLTEIIGFNTLIDLGFLFSIENNPKLVTLNGFNRATDVYGDFWINGNTSLESISGFTRLAAIHNTFAINDCPVLSNIPSFNNIILVNWFIQFYNTGLTDIIGFDNLTTIGDSGNLISGLNASNNQNLIAISGFNCLDRITFDLLIQDNPLLESVVGLSSLESVGQFVTIRNNGSLSSLNGFQNLTSVGSAGYETTVVLEIHDNPQLADCNALCNILSSNGITGLTNIYNNLVGCNTETEIETTNCATFQGISCTSLTQPLSGDINVDLETNLSWNTIAGATGYLISIGTSPEGAQIAYNVVIDNGTTYNLPDALPEDTEIFVKIKPYNNTVQATCCIEESFTTQNIPLSCTQLLQPANNATNVPITTNLSWEPVLGATGYTLSIGTSSGATNIANQLEIVGATNFTPTENLPENTRIFVTIIPNNASENSTGCIEESFVTAATKAETLIVPKFFTPNNDGQNDTWVVEDPLNEVEGVFIYNRYGMLIKTLYELQAGWNGLFNNQLMPVNDYWYVIKLKDGNQINGHFTLKH